MLSLQIELSLKYKSSLKSKKNSLGMKTFAGAGCSRAVWPRKLRKPGLQVKSKAFLDFEHHVKLKTIDPGKKYQTQQPICKAKWPMD